MPNQKNDPNAKYVVIRAIPSEFSRAKKGTDAKFEVLEKFEAFGDQDTYLLKFEGENQDAAVAFTYLEPSDEGPGFHGTCQDSYDDGFRTAVQKAEGQ